jgi:hypothetical protein
MKLQYRTGIILMSFAILLSCKKTLEINQDPNFPTEASANLLLPSAEVQMAYSLGGEASRVTGNFVQHYAGHRGQPLEYNQYDVNPASTDGFWEAMYAVVLRDLKAIIDQSRATGDSMYVGTAQILTAHTFSVLTDLYGDIPFSETLQDERNLNPKYDKQEAIYPALISLIEAGIANVKSNVGRAPEEDDLIYGGDMTLWEKYGNSLKLRLLNHLSKRQPGAAASFLNTNPALISSNAENAKVTFGNTSSNANPIHGFDVLSGRKDMAVASTLVEKMKQLNDPRIPQFFFPVKNTGAGRQGQFFGNDPGVDADDAGETKFSRIGPAFASINSPVMLISYAEVQFIIAEIRLREGNVAQAATAYNGAITADFDFLGVSGAATYLAKSNVLFNNTLQRLMEQKWITMFQAPYESWVDWRRTGFPVLTPAAVNRTDNVIPRRLPYPQLEINLNRISLEAGPGVPVPFESLKQRVWWDVA